MAKKIVINSDYKGVVTLEVLKGANRYNEWIYENLKPHVKFPAIEVGAGIGNISSYFAKDGNLVLTDIDEGLVSHLEKKFKDNQIYRLDISKDPPKKLLNKFNSVICVNVLEHIEEDEKALRNIKKILKNDGKLVLLVPANKWAFNTLDKELGHFRRYGKEELTKKIEKTGLHLENISLFNALGLVTWVVRNYLKGQEIQLTQKQVAAFDLVVPVVKKIEKKFPMPIGISLIAVAKK